jgi:hypothetical protein
MAVNVFIMLYKTIMSLKIAFFKIKRKYILWKMSKAKKDLVGSESNKVNS